MLKCQNQTQEHMKDYNKKLKTSKLMNKSQSYHLSITHFVHVPKQIIHD